MKRLITGAALASVLLLLLGSNLAYSQATFKIPFKFEAAGKSYPAGSYLISIEEDGKISLKRETGGVEALLPFSKKLEKPEPPIEAPQLIFDMVANFEPSYTEYVTDYLLAEVWLNEKDGFLVLTEDRSEYTKIVKGEKAGK